MNTIQTRQEREKTMAQIEKRHHSRYQSVNLSYVCLNEEKQIITQSMGRTLNVSETGLLLETHFEIDKTNTVRLTIGLEDDTVEIEGQVVYARPLENGKYGTGIEFSENDIKSRDIWKQFINSVCQGSSRADAGS